jgi:hypothetical protein
MRLKTAFLAALIMCVPAIARGAAITIDPTSDGYVYVGSTSVTVFDTSYVLVAPEPQGSDQGVIKFSTAGISGTVTQALLSLNPYALPLWGPQVDVYGYGTDNGQLTALDANAGSYLGTLTLPPNLGFGEDVFFDVTSFVSGTSSFSFVAFNLRSADTDTFSSLEYNYGHPAQLLVTMLPEPGGLLLLAVGLVSFGGAARRPRRA